MCLCTRCCAHNGTHACVCVSSEAGPESVLFLFEASPNILRPLAAEQWRRPAPRAATRPCAHCAIAKSRKAGLLSKQISTTTVCFIFPDGEAIAMSNFESFSKGNAVWMNKAKCAARCSEKKTPLKELWKCKTCHTAETLGNQARKTGRNVHMLTLCNRVAGPRMYQCISDTSLAGHLIKHGMAY